MMAVLVDRASSTRRQEQHRGHQARAIAARPSLKLQAIASLQALPAARRPIRAASWEYDGGFGAFGQDTVRLQKLSPTIRANWAREWT